MLENPVETLTAAVYAACSRDLPNIQKITGVDPESQRKYLSPLPVADQRKFFAKKPSLENIPDFIHYHSVRGIKLQSTNLRPTERNCEVSMFLQPWQHTLLGYDSNPLVQCREASQAYTVVVRCLATGCAAVYFGHGGRLAYLVMLDQQGEAWSQALASHTLPGQREAKNRFGWDIPISMEPKKPVREVEKILYYVA